MIEALTHIAAFAVGIWAGWRLAILVVRTQITDKLRDGKTVTATDRRTGERYTFGRVDLPKKP